MNNSNSSLNSVIENEDDHLEYINNNMRKAVLPVTIMIGIENVIGLIGNVLVLIVYSRLYHKCNFRYFVLSLAVVDLTSCLTCIPGEIFEQLNWYKNNYTWICKIKAYFNVFGASGSALILLLLAFDRYRKICKPLAWQIQPSLARKLSISAIICAVFVSTPVIILWGKQTYVYKTDDFEVNVSVCEKSKDITKNTCCHFIYIVSAFVIPTCLMMVVICVLNISIGKVLFCTNVNRLSWTKCKSTPHTVSVTSLSTATKNPEIKTDKISKDEITDESDSGKDCAGHSTSDLHCSSQEPSLTDTECTEKKMLSLSVVSLPDIALNSIDITHGRSTAHKSVSNAETLESMGDTTNESSKNEQTTNSPATKISVGRYHKVSVNQTQRKTIIMLVLSTVFVVTMSLYSILISLIAEANMLQQFSNSQKATYFLFLRLYFVNCIINPFLYGFMDPRFRTGIRKLLNWNP